MQGVAQGLRKCLGLQVLAAAYHKEIRASCNQLPVGSLCQKIPGPLHTPPCGIIRETALDQLSAAERACSLQSLPPPNQPSSGGTVKAQVTGRADLPPSVTNLKARPGCAASSCDTPAPLTAQQHTTQISRPLAPASSDRSAVQCNAPAPPAPSTHALLRAVQPQAPDIVQGPPDWHDLKAGIGPTDVSVPGVCKGPVLVHGPSRDGTALVKEHPGSLPQHVSTCRADTREGMAQGLEEAPLNPERSKNYDQSRSEVEKGESCRALMSRADPVLGRMQHDFEEHAPICQCGHCLSACRACCHGASAGTAAEACCTPVARTASHLERRHSPASAHRLKTTPKRKAVGPTSQPINGKKHPCIQAPALSLDGFATDTPSDG